MIIREISREVFDDFSKNNMFGSFYQTSSYGSTMGSQGYIEVYIGGFIDDKLVGAALILSRTISLNVKYGYSPRGFLIDYFDKELFSSFTSGIKAYFLKKGYY